MISEKNLNLLKQIWINSIVDESELRYCYPFELDKILNEARQEGRMEMHSALRLTTPNVLDKFL